MQTVAVEAGCSGLHSIICCFITWSCIVVIYCLHRTSAVVIIIMIILLSFHNISFYVYIYYYCCYYLWLDSLPRTGTVTTATSI